MNKIIIRIVIIYKEDMEGDEIIMCGIGEKNE